MEKSENLKKIKTITELSKLLVNMNKDNKFEIQKIKYDDNVLIFEKINDNIKLKVKIYKNSYLKKIIENLPLVINTLELDFLNFKFYKDNIDCLDNIFTNLPMNLNTIKFIYPYLFEKYMSNEYGDFNLLFGIKIPMNCQIFVLFGKNTYSIIYEKPNILKLTLEKSSPTIKLTCNDNKRTIEYNYDKQRIIAGGPVQLAAYGVLDVYLTKNN